MKYTQIQIQKEIHFNLVKAGSKPLKIVTD